MAAAGRLVVALLVFCTPAQTARVKKHFSETSCCCKPEACREGSEGTVYHLDEDMCCKFRKKCGRTSGVISFPSEYNIEKDDTMCQKRDSPRGLPDWFEGGSRPVDVDTSEGSHADILDTHCKHQEKVDEATEPERKQMQNMLGKIANELEKNSVLKASRELFTMYACVRWAPDHSYWPLAQDELANENLPSDSQAAAGDPLALTARAAERGHFIPLRCSENIGVYDHKEVNDSKVQHYPVFERRMMAMSSFFSKEADGYFDSRAKKHEQPRSWEWLWTSDEAKKERWNGLLQDALLFNVKAVTKAQKSCSGSNLSMDARKAASTELMKDCSFLEWWTPKLRMYTQRFPFEAFIAGNKGAKINPGHRVLLCFGKRVAGELHRRNEGTHILTDMNGVGCHGFWDYTHAGKMLQNIVDLWAPPTCQLTALELKMRTQMLSMFAEMNKRLFESLPALIAAEQFSDAIPSAKEARGVQSVVSAGRYVNNKMSGLFETYKGLGELLTTSVMKWSVCPIGKEEGLEKVLGSDDLVVQKYAQTAYQQWTGQSADLPGQACDSVSSSERQTCRIGTVRSNYPEFYKDVEYACPALPLMPAPQQLKILKEAHTSKCFVKATPEQLGTHHWHYMGLRPTEVQFPPRDFIATEQMEAVQVLDLRQRLDEFGIVKHYVTLGRVCTLEVRQKYPRWCSAAALLNTPSHVDNALGAAEEALDAAIGTVTDIAQERSDNASAEWKEWAQRQASTVGRRITGAITSASSTSTATIAGHRAAMRRHERIANSRLYKSEDAGLALWGMTFQTREGGGGEREQFNRFVTTVPCDGVDVRAEIESEFTWGQAALELFGKVTRNAGHVVFKDTLHLAARTEVELREGNNLGRANHIAWRADSTDTKDEWSHTRDRFPHLEKILRLGTRNTISTSMPDVFGLSVVFHCGRREDLYNNRYNLDPGKLAEPFQACLQKGVDLANDRAKREGKEEKQLEKAHSKLEDLKADLKQLQMQTATDTMDTMVSPAELQAQFDEKTASIEQVEADIAELYREKPLTLKEFDDEIAVRVDFTSLSVCEYYGGSLDEQIRLGAGGSSYTHRKNKDAAEAMVTKQKGCRQVSPSKHKGEKRSGVVGAYMGAEMPLNTRAEVILSPLDVKTWNEAK
jgi:hypothetical protein